MGKCLADFDWASGRLVFSELDEDGNDYEFIINQSHCEDRLIEVDMIIVYSDDKSRKRQSLEMINEYNKNVITMSLTYSDLLLLRGHIGAHIKRYEFIKNNKPPTKRSINND